MLNTKQIVIVQYSANFDGSALSALSLANGLLQSGWTTHVVFASDGPIIPLFKEHEHTTHVFPHKNWLRRNSILRFLKDSYTEILAGLRFRVILQQLQPQAVYINTTTGLFAAVSANLVNIPVIWHLRELFDEVGGELVCPSIFRPIVRKVIYGMANQVVVNALAVAQNISGRKYLDRAIVVPNAVDRRFLLAEKDKLHSRTMLGVGIEYSTVIGIPGTPRPMKGHKFFLQAIASYLEYHKDILILISGSGNKEYRDELSVLARELGITTQVLFTGMLRDMTLFYSACDLVVVPSIAEPFGRVIIEAFASRVPVIATRVGGIPEIIEDGYNGKLISYGNTSQLVEAVDEFIQNAESAAGLALVAYNEVLTKYTEELYQNRLTRIIEDQL